MQQYRLLCLIFIESSFSSVIISSTETRWHPYSERLKSEACQQKKARAATADVMQDIIGMFGATAWKQGQHYLERCSLWMHFIGLTDTPSELLYSQTNPTNGGFVCPRRHSKMSFQLLRYFPVTENPCTVVS